MRERDEFEEFVAGEMPRLLGFAYALTWTPHDAWDLVQESLVRVGVRWSRVRDGNPGGYARTTLVRLNIDRIRHRRRELLGRSQPDVPVEVDGGLDPALVGITPPLTDRVALQEGISRAVGMPTMVVEEERPVPTGG